MGFTNPVSTVIGNTMMAAIAILLSALIVLGLHDVTVTGERNVLEQIVKTKDAEIAGKVKDVAFMKAWVERDKLDAIAKDVEYNRTMAAKPKYITSIKYVPTGEKCADLSAIAEEARKNAEGGKL